MTQPFGRPGGAPLSAVEQAILDEIAAGLKRNESAAEPPIASEAATVELPRFPASLTDEVMDIHRAAPGHRRAWQVVTLAVLLAILGALAFLAVYLSA